MNTKIALHNQFTYAMAFGENLKRLRQDRGLTQGELAKKADLRVASISTLEQNEGDPKLSTIYKLVDALGCSPDALLLDLGAAGLDGTLKMMTERAEKLPEREKAIIIDVIDTYCINHGFNEVVDQGWRKFAIITKGNKKQRVLDELSEESS